jgi:Hydrazine synthase alpha subunit middle domain/WD40-like Beta Propeller Repeat
MADEARLEAPAGIAFVGGPVVDGLEGEYAGAYHWRDGYVYPKGATFNAWERTHSAPRPGRNLFSLVPARPDGRLTQLTFLKNGNVWDPEPSFDGKKLLFSMRKDDEEWYHLFEVGIDGTGLRQLTDGPFNDISGVYLPDGRIIFCSDRSGVLDEYHEERSEFLFRMRADGTGIEQITFVPGIYFEPTVLQNGLVLCSFWDAFHISVAPFIKHETYLITLRPDGTEERHLFGAGEYKFYNRTRHSAIGLTRAGELPDGRILLQSEMGPSIYDPNLGTALGLALAPVFPGAASAQTGGTTHAVHLSPLGTRTSPYPLADGRFLMASTLPGSRDLEISIVDPRTRAIETVFNRPNLSEWDAVPIGQSRAVPKLLPDKQRDRQSEFATFVVAAGRHGDTPERNELNRRARFLRVLQAEYTDVTTSSHTSLETRVLGTVPLLADGSAAFEAPAETPLFLETLDARGNRLVLQAGYMAARAGEVKSCTGCHAPQTRPVANAKLQALDRPLPRVARDSTDLSYRRNDPDEYRRQALVTQAPVYRAWLERKSPEMRRRGLEMLAWLPDEVTAADRARMVELLNDEAVEVRRQAAFALAMTGSADEIPALIDLVSNSALPPQSRQGERTGGGTKRDASQFAANQRTPGHDWQTVHYALMALEAITGQNLALAADLDQAPAAWRAWWKETGSTAKFLDGLSARGGRFADDFERDAWLEAVARTRWLSTEPSRAVATRSLAAWRGRVRELLAGSPPVAAIRAAGALADPEAVALVAPFLVRGGMAATDETCPDCDDALAREVAGTALAKESAMALGRIGTDAARDLLWQMVAKTVPNTAPVASRHYQSGPRPEEYTYLRALILANAVPTLEHVPYLIGLLPYTEGEKPRFEDRTKSDSQRVWLGRILLNRAGLRRPVVRLASEILAGNGDSKSPLYQQVLKGTNIDRPRSEHGRIFPVVQELAAEQALHLLSCLAESAEEIPEPLVAACLTSPNHRERIEAAVIFRRFAYSPGTERILREEASRPYSFGEIWSIGKGRPDTQFRDKAYLMMALGAHARDLAALETFTDYTRFYRDIRIGLALGLGFRGTPDGFPLLVKLAGDPIFAVHRECANARIEVRDAEQLAGRDGVLPALPGRIPLKPEYQSPTFDFADRTPEPRGLAGSVTIEVADPQGAIKALRAAVDAAQYKNVGNGFARNAERMRLTDADVLAAVIESSAARDLPLSTELKDALSAALDSPYPLAHYLAARLIALRNEQSFVPVLVQKLPAYAGAADTVGFYWVADALGRLRAESAVAALEPFAVAKPFDRTYGPVGMAYGFAAARALGMVAGDMQHAVVERLLSGDNVWLRSGVLDGLAERGDPRLVKQFETLLAQPQSAILEEELRYGLRLLTAGARDRLGGTP